MGAYRIRREVRQRIPGYGDVLGFILFGVGASMFLGFFLIALDTRPDLSGGHPRGTGANEIALPVGWPSLLVDDAASRTWADTSPKNGVIVKILGYMMDGYQFAPRGSRVRMFVLMPSAGTFLHPAHRDPDEMVEVWVKAGTVAFEERQLVWASGKFERLVTSGEDHALYALREASVAPALDQDIAGWFTR